MSDFIPFADRLPCGVELTPEIAKIIKSVEADGFYWWGDYLERVKDKERFYLVYIRIYPHRHTVATGRQPVFIDAIKEAVRNMNGCKRITNI